MDEFNLPAEPGRPARLAVGIVSAGRVGSVLGAALARAGHLVVAASAISNASLQRAERLLPDVPLLPPDEVVRRADLVVLAVPDDVLSGLVAGLVATGAIRPGQIVVHTSGRYGVEILRPAMDAGALPLALHPVMTFTGRSEDLNRLVSCSMGVTAAAGDEVAWHVGEALAVEMGTEPIRVPEQARLLYHTALSYGANYLATVVADSLEALRKAGVSEPERVLAPLLSAALDNSLRQGDRLMTGPVARGDSETVRDHLTELSARMPELVPAYAVLATRTLTRAATANLLSEDAAAELGALLQDFTEGHDAP